MTILASRNATAADFERVIAAVRGGRVRPTEWLTHRVALGDLPSRFDDIRADPTLVKAIVDVDA